MTSDDWFLFFQFLWRSRPRLPRLPLLTGPCLAVAVGFAGTWLVTGPLLAFTGALKLAVLFTSAGAFLALWCIASVMDGHWSGAAALARRRLTDTARLAERSKWTRAERAALRDETSLEGLLASTGAQARPEGKFR